MNATIEQLLQIIGELEVARRLQAEEIARLRAERELKTPASKEEK